MDSTIVKEYKTGKVRKFTLENGYEFEAYVPNNCNVNTSIMIYEHGDGGYYNDWRSYDKKFLTDGCNSIVVRADRNNSIALYDHIVDYYNLNEAKRMTVSFSGGTVYAMNETAQMIEQNPNASAPLAVIMDGYVPTGHLSSNGVIETLKESNTLVLAFAQSGSSNSYVSQYEKMAKMGVNVIILRDQSTYGNSHSGVNTSFMEGGILEYTLGEGKLPDRYKIYVYDSEKKEFISLEHSQVETLNDVYQYFGINTLKSSANKLLNLNDFSITSDNVVVTRYLNSILAAIRNTDFLNVNFQSSFESTTQIPSSVATVVQNYFAKSAAVLENVSNLVDAIASIDKIYERTDKRLSLDAGILEKFFSSVNEKIDVVEDIFDKKED